MTNSIQLPFYKIVEPYHNKQLFADYYLDHILTKQDAWKDSLMGSKQFLAWLNTLYNQEKNNLAAYSEEQLERHWFRPILSKLGHVFESQAPIQGLQDDHTKRPDYMFFANETARQTALHEITTDNYEKHALAIGEVKKWDIPLSKKLRHGDPHFSAQNPMWQIDYYLQASNLKWGIISNGKIWRLVHANSSQKLTTFYEVNLTELLNANNAKSFRYFYAFFHQSAFTPNPQGHVLLETVLTGSHDYAIGVEQDLRENAYHALVTLMQGFWDIRQNNLDESDLHAIYENSLYLLYRLLFILYAESKNLLPIDKPIYQENYGMRNINISPIADETLLKNGKRYWYYMHGLFELINGTNPYLNAELKIPRYNGGLFDSEQHVFFVEKYVGDKAFVKAIRLLRQRIFDDKPQNVDYAALGVRQLGSIYEGLLEYQPQFIPSLSDENREKTIELITDKGERKATGSYYTPEYIVQYIVENTLDPLIEQIRQKVKRACKTAQTDAERHAIEQSFGEHVLALKILDPAMGSGHFLVAAADYLTMAIVTDPYMAIDDNFDSEMMAWKRRVVENCLYGVDKNALAVELAKLSLWISTIAHDKPLNFLDHHLRHGDSLIGANLINLKNAPPMLFSKKELAQRQKHVSTLFDSRLSKQLPTMLKQIHQIMNQTSDTYDDVLQKDSTYRQLQIVKKPFIALADMWISAYFENTFSVNDFDESMQLLDTPHAFFEHASIKNIMDSNQLNMGRKHDFFHWQLEFPEAFFDKHGQPLENAGFDAVIGNPPYGAKLSPHDKTYIKQFYTCTGSKDTAEFMFEKSMLLGKYMIGMIIPKALAFYSSWHAIRDWLINRSVLQNVCDVGIAFADANYEELIIITSLHVNTKIRPRIDRFEPLRRYVEEKKLVHKGNLFFEYVRENGFIIFTELDNTDLQILQKIRDKSIRLHDISENTFRGLYISDAQKKKLKSGHDQFVESVPVVKRYQIDKMWHVDLSNPKWQNKIRKIKNPRIFFKVMRGNRLICNYDLGELITTEKLVNVTIQESSMYDIRAVTAIINTPLPSFFIQKVIFSDTTETSRVMDAPYSGFISIPKINFTTPAEIRHTILESGQAIYHDMLENFDFLEKFNFHESAMFTFIDARLQADQTDVIHDMLAYLAEQMMTLNKEKQQIAENFWLDMEGMVNESTFKVLRNKGKRKSTLAKKTVFQQFINAKSHATCKLDNTLAWNEKTFKAFIRLLDKKIRFSHVVAIYRDYAPDYRQCVQKIIMTDQLIDHIVYQLYGLTESEIAVVQK